MPLEIVQTVINPKQKEDVRQRKRLPNPYESRTEHVNEELQKSITEVQDIKLFKVTTEVVTQKNNNTSNMIQSLLYSRHRTKAPETYVKKSLVGAELSKLIVTHVDMKEVSAHEIQSKDECNKELKKDHEKLQETIQHMRNLRRQQHQPLDISEKALPASPRTKLFNDNNTNNANTNQNSPAKNMLKPTPPVNASPRTERSLNMDRKALIALSEQRRREVQLRPQRLYDTADPANNHSTTGTTNNNGTSMNSPRMTPAAAAVYADHSAEASIDWALQSSRFHVKELESELLAFEKTLRVGYESHTAAGGGGGNSSDSSENNDDRGMTGKRSPRRSILGSGAGGAGDNNNNANNANNKGKKSPRRQKKRKGDYDLSETDVAQKIETDLSELDKSLHHDMMRRQQLKAKQERRLQRQLQIAQQQQLSLQHNTQLQHRQQQQKHHVRHANQVSNSKQQGSHQQAMSLSRNVSNSSLMRSASQSSMGSHHSGETTHTQDTALTGTTAGTKQTSNNKYRSPSRERRNSHRKHHRNDEDNDERYAQEDKEVMLNSEGTEVVKDLHMLKLKQRRRLFESTLSHRPNPTITNDHNNNTTATNNTSKTNHNNTTTNTATNTNNNNASIDGNHSNHMSNNSRSATATAAAAAAGPAVSSMSRRNSYAHNNQHSHGDGSRQNSRRNSSRLDLFMGAVPLQLTSALSSRLHSRRNSSEISSSYHLATAAQGSSIERSASFNTDDDRNSSTNHINNNPSNMKSHNHSLDDSQYTDHQDDSREDFDALHLHNPLYAFQHHHNHQPIPPNSPPPSYRGYTAGIALLDGNFPSNHNHNSSSSHTPATGNDRKANFVAKHALQHSPVDVRQQRLQSLATFRRLTAPTIPVLSATTPNQPSHHHHQQQHQQHQHQQHQHQQHQQEHLDHGTMDHMKEDDNNMLMTAAMAAALQHHHQDLQHSSDVSNVLNHDPTSNSMRDLHANHQSNSSLPSLYISGSASVSVSESMSQSLAVSASTESALLPADQSLKGSPKHNTHNTNNNNNATTKNTHTNKNLGIIEDGSTKTEAEKAALLAANRSDRLYKLHVVDQIVEKVIQHSKTQALKIQQRQQQEASLYDLPPRQQSPTNRLDSGDMLIARAKMSHTPSNTARVVHNSNNTVTTHSHHHSHHNNEVQSSANNSVASTPATMHLKNVYNSIESSVGDPFGEHKHRDTPSILYFVSPLDTLSRKIVLDGNADTSRGGLPYRDTEMAEIARVMAQKQRKEIGEHRIIRNNELIDTMKDKIEGQEGIQHVTEVEERSDAIHVAKRTGRAIALDMRVMKELTMSMSQRATKTSAHLVASYQRSQKTNVADLTEYVQQLTDITFLRPLHQRRRRDQLWCLDLQQMQYMVRKLAPTDMVLAEGDDYYHMRKHSHKVHPRSHKHGAEHHHHQHDDSDEDEEEDEDYFPGQTNFTSNNKKTATNLTPITTTSAKPKSNSSNSSTTFLTQRRLSQSSTASTNSTVSTAKRPTSGTSTTTAATTNDSKTNNTDSNSSNTATMTLTSSNLAALQQQLPPSASSPNSNASKMTIAGVSNLMVNTSLAADNINMDTNLGSPKPVKMPLSVYEAKKILARKQLQFAQQEQLLQHEQYNRQLRVKRMQRDLLYRHRHWRHDFQHLYDYANLMESRLQRNEEEFVMLGRQRVRKRNWFVLLLRKIQRLKRSAASAKAVPASLFLLLATLKKLIVLDVQFDKQVIWRLVDETVAAEEYGSNLVYSALQMVFDSVGITAEEVYQRLKTRLHISNNNSNHHHSSSSKKNNHKNSKNKNKKDKKVSSTTANTDVTDHNSSVSNNNTAANNVGLSGHSQQQIHLAPKLLANVRKERKMKALRQRVVRQQERRAKRRQKKRMKLVQQQQTLGALVEEGDNEDEDEEEEDNEEEEGVDNEDHNYNSNSNNKNSNNSNSHKRKTVRMMDNNNNNALKTTSNTSATITTTAPNSNDTNNTNTNMGNKDGDSNKNNVPVVAHLELTQQGLKTHRLAFISPSSPSSPRNHRNLDTSDNVSVQSDHSSVMSDSLDGDSIADTEYSEDHEDDNRSYLGENDSDNGSVLSELEESYEKHPEEEVDFDQLDVQAYLQ